MLKFERGLGNSASETLLASQTVCGDDSLKKKNQPFTNGSRDFVEDRSLPPARRLLRGLGSQERTFQRSGGKPPYPPDLAPSGFLAISHDRNWPRGQDRSDAVEDIRVNATAGLREIPKRDFRRCVRQ